MRYTVGTVINCFVFLFHITCANVLLLMWYGWNCIIKPLFSHCLGCKGSEKAQWSHLLFMYELGCQETSFGLSWVVFLDRSNFLFLSLPSLSREGNRRCLRTQPGSPDFYQAATPCLPGPSPATTVQVVPSNPSLFYSHHLLCLIAFL